MPDPISKFGLFLGIGLIGAFVTTSAYLAAIQLSLPPTDLAYGQSIFQVWSDPFVRAVAVPVALFSGVLSAPVLFRCLRSTRLVVALPVVLLSVLTTTVLCTLVSPLLGWFMSYVALVASCVVCAKLGFTRQPET